MVLKAHSDWLVKLRVRSAIYLRATREKNDPLVCIREVKKSSTLIFCGVHYLTILVYTKTTIHLSVGGRFMAQKIPSSHLHFSE